MSRTYRQEGFFQHRSPGGTGKVRDYIKRMAPKLSSQQFYEKGLFVVAGFLTKFVRESNTQEMSKTRGLVSSPSLLNGLSKYQYEADVEMVSPKR